MPYSHLYGAVRPAATPTQPHHTGVALSPEAYNLLCELAPRSDFFSSLLRQFRERGCLSPKQAEAIERERVKRANTRTMDVSRIEASFARAKSLGIAQPQMYLGDYKLRCASAMSANAGAIYVTLDGLYLGKVDQGQWRPNSDGANHTDALAALFADPTTAALAYGQRTGRCAICARKLTAKESIERTIGPICASKYGL